MLPPWEHCFFANRLQGIMFVELLILGYIMNTIAKISTQAYIVIYFKGTAAAFSVWINKHIQISSQFYLTRDYY